MKQGEKSLLICKADYAYGSQGSPPKIPGGATLHFEVRQPPQHPGCAHLPLWAEGAAAALVMVLGCQCSHVPG